MTAKITKHLVIYADDDLDDQEFVSQVLLSYSENIDLVLLNNGVEAVNFLKDPKHYDRNICLIILDINMPLMTGKEALLEIKNIPHAADIPVVLFTTSNQPNDIKFAKQHGAGFITKPINYQQIENLGKLFIDHCAGEVRRNILGRESS